MISARLKQSWLWGLAFLAGGVLVAVQMRIAEIGQMTAYYLTGIQFAAFGILGYFAGSRMQAHRHGIMNLIACIAIGCAYAICFFVPGFKLDLHITPLIMVFLFAENVGFLYCRYHNNQHYTDLRKKFMPEICGVILLCGAGIHAHSEEFFGWPFILLSHGSFFIIYGLLFKWKMPRVCLEILFGPLRGKFKRRAVES